jgi:hypothetical protein
MKVKTCGYVPNWSEERKGEGKGFVNGIRLREDDRREDYHYSRPTGGKRRSVDKDTLRTLHGRLSSLLPDYWVRMEIAAFSCLFFFSSSSFPSAGFRV